MAVWRRGTILRFGLNCTSATTVHPNTCPVPHCHQDEPLEKSSSPPSGQGRGLLTPRWPFTPLEGPEGRAGGRHFAKHCRVDPWRGSSWSSADPKQEGDSQTAVGSFAGDLQMPQLEGQSVPGVTWGERTMWQTGSQESESLARESPDSFLPLATQKPAPLITDSWVPLPPSAHPVAYSRGN